MNLSSILSSGLAAFPIVTLALLGSGCTVTGYGIVHSSSKSVLSFEGTVMGADGRPWSGRGQVCYHVENLGMSNKDGCANFDASKTPGSFVVEQDISEFSRNIPVYFNQKVWLDMSGTVVPGTIMSTGVEQNNLTINGNSMSIAKVAIGASFRMPAEIPSQPVLVQTPAQLSSTAFKSLEGRPQAGLGATVSEQDFAKSVENPNSGLKATAGVVAGAIRI